MLEFLQHRLVLCLKGIPHLMHKQACVVLILGAFDKLRWVDHAVLTRVIPRQGLIERSHWPSRGDGMDLMSPQVTHSTSKALGG